MKRISFILISLLFTHNINSQSGWFWQNPLPQGNDLYSVSCPSSNVFYTAGDGGTILKSTNAGYNWSIIQYDPNIYIYSSYFINENTGFISGIIYPYPVHSFIRKTTDGGITWVQNFLTDSASIGELFFVDNNTGYIIGHSTYFSNSLLYKTINGGLNWDLKYQSPDISFRYIYFLNEQTGFITADTGTSRGRIFMTTNGGNNWQRVYYYKLSNNFVSDLVFTNSMTGFCTGSRLLTTTNGGFNWYVQSQTPGGTIQFMNSTTGYMISSFTNSILKTTNTGINWQIDKEFNAYVYDIKKYNALDIIITGISGLIAKTINSGSNWIQFSSGFNHTVWDICFNDELTGIATGNYGALLRTTNGGVNWNIMQFNMSYDLDPLVRIDNETFLVNETFSGTIFKTTNNGLSWDSIYTGLYAINKLKFINPNTGFGVCKYNKFIKTTNGGINWVVRSNLNHAQNWSMDFINEMTGFAGGEVTSKTTNSGESWDTLSFPTEFYSSDIQFINQNTGFLAGSVYSNYTSFGVIKRTTNCGTSWTDISVSQSMLEDIYFIDETTGFVSANSSVYKTTNSGLNWFELQTCSAGGFEDIWFLNNSTGYIVGDGGVIIKTTNGGGEPIGITPISTEMPDKFILFQNYPNPFNPTTKIKFEIPNSPFEGGKGDVKLVVYDILGREITVLVNESLIPGTYEIE